MLRMLRIGPPGSLGGAGSDMLEDTRPALARLVIEKLRLAGIQLAVDRDAVVFYPPHSIPDDLLEGLRRYEPEIIASLTAEAETLAMPLDVFEARGAMAEIRVPWLPMTLWFVPSEREAAGLTGISRGRIWTARELIDLIRSIIESGRLSRRSPARSLSSAGTLSRSEFGATQATGSPLGTDRCDRESPLEQRGPRVGAAVGPGSRKGLPAVAKAKASWVGKQSR